MKPKKITQTNIYYQLEYQNKAGVWMPVNTGWFVNGQSTMEGIKQEVKYYNNARLYNKDCPILPRTRRIAKVTDIITTVRTKERA